jgi:hypothetical protein
MMFKTMTRVAILTLVSSTTCAGQIQTAGFQKPACAEECCVEPCGMVCCATVKTVSEKKHCFEVECVPVCIPKVHCPLFRFFASNNPSGCGEEDCDGGCCDGLCGEVRVVHKLKKTSYECEKQVVVWSVRRIDAGCAKCSEGCAPAGGCTVSAVNR